MLRKFNSSVACSPDTSEFAADPPSGLSSKVQRVLRFHDGEMPTKYIFSPDDAGNA